MPKKPAKRRPSAYGEAVGGLFDVASAIVGVSPEWTETKKPRRVGAKRKRR